MLKLRNPKNNYYEIAHSQHKHIEIITVKKLFFQQKKNSSIFLRTLITSRTSVLIAPLLPISLKQK